MGAEETRGMKQLVSRRDRRLCRPFPVRDPRRPGAGGGLYGLSYPHTASVPFTAEAAQPTPRRAPAGAPRTREERSRRPSGRTTRGGSVLPGGGQQPARGCGAFGAARPPRCSDPPPPLRLAPRVREPRPRRLTRARLQGSSSRGRRGVRRAPVAGTPRPSPPGLSWTLLPERRRRPLIGGRFSALGNKPRSD